MKAAMLAQKAESQFARMNVSAICRAAGVSRASLYSHHPDLVREILAWGGKPRSRDKPKRQPGYLLEELQADKKDLQRRLNSLLLICVELQAEVRTLRTLMSKSSQKKVRQKNESPK